MDIGRACVMRRRWLFSYIYKYEYIYTHSYMHKHIRYLIEQECSDIVCTILTYNEQLSSKNLL